MKIPLQIEPASGSPPSVAYRWDTDTDILTAYLDSVATSGGASGSVEIEGSDGSWIILDMHSGRIRGIEVAVWPDVRKLPALACPDAEYASVTVPVEPTQPVASLEVNTPVAAEADRPERVFHFRLGAPRQTRPVRLARDIVLEVDGHDALAGLWLLNVPPFPDDV